MLNTVCWMCKAKTGHAQVGDARAVRGEAALDDPSLRLLCAAFECQVCGGLAVALTVQVAHEIGGRAENAVVAELGEKEFFWRPAPGETKAYPRVPEHIAEAATEAYESYAGQHYRAAILLSRSVIEATAKAKDIVTGSLADKIDEMAEKGLIRPNIKEFAHGIRAFGNDMAHGDFVVPVSAEEAELVIELMGEILNEVFQAPAKLEAVRAALTERKTQGAQ
ncbi:DUF4145 domain-containing protein [Mycolicibacterium sp. GESEQ-9]|uniref:DUF4145 domain-containing protein n=1 Tax=Mycolicibacterium sp. GESEQ-9 TaxID=2812656 RepID=UPI0027DC3A74|nr:DUF4145 domain-containing protein [Mycolicibacterium sp. GESEQ-9]